MKVFNFLKNYFSSWLRIRFISIRNRVKCERRVKLAKTATLKTRDGGSVIINNNVTVKENAELLACGGKLIIKGGNYINRNTMIVCKESITVGKGTTIGPNTVIYDHDHDIKNGHGLISSPVEIGDNVWIGAGVTILRGTVIGAGSVIAAGTVVRGTVPPGVIAYNQKELQFKPL